MRERQRKQVVAGRGEQAVRPAAPRLHTGHDRAVPASLQVSGAPAPSRRASGWLDPAADPDSGSSAEMRVVARTRDATPTMTGDLHRGLRRYGPCLALDGFSFLGRWF